ncbi:MAG: hypothetical protein JW874_02235 [Spirochaetales bacterium]|nr:hypothetical protein [Spirochaetales bacterium]
MLRKTAIPFFLIITGLLISACATAGIPENDGELLRWKMNGTEILVYDTELKEVTGDHQDLLGVFDGLKEGDTETAAYLQDEFEKIETIQKDSIMKTILQKGNDDVMQMTMVIGPGQRISDDFSVVDDLVGHDSGVMLRGAVDSSGKIVSFWVQRGQKNLVAMLLELPENRVNIGDTWSIDIDFIENDQTFICSNSDRKNTVTLLDLREEDEDTVAVIKYDIHESVSGTFPGATFGLDMDIVEVTISIGFRGLAEFSLGKGMWLRYEGIMDMENKGLQDSRSVRKISMKPE